MTKVHLTPQIRPVGHTAVDHCMYIGQRFTLCMHYNVHAT